MPAAETPHMFLDEADNVLKAAERMGVGVFARQASEFAPDGDRAQDTVIVILRGECARLGRDALIAVADLVRAGA